MQVKTAVVWWLVNGEDHPTLSMSDKNGEGLAPLISAMFPGINYYSISGLSKVLRELVIPALRARHAEVGRLATREVRASDMVEVAEVLPCDGYQWQTDRAWMLQFKQAIEA